MTKLETKQRDPFDFPPITNAVIYEGVEYTFRELTVSEIDDAREMSTDKTTGWDGRLMTRLMITMASVDPRIGMEDLAKFPQRLYARVVDLVNDLNDPDASEKDDPGKS